MENGALALFEDEHSFRGKNEESQSKGTPCVEHYQSEGRHMQDTMIEDDVAEQNVLKPKGDLTIFEAGKFHEELVQLHGGKGPLELNLSEVGRLDSSCIQLIVAATRCGRLRVTGYSQAIRDKFEHIGFAQFLPHRQGGGEGAGKADPASRG
jgi:anti-anti-sigma regulatory factor